MWSSAAQLTAIRLELKGATWQAEANAPGKGIFDDLLEGVLPGRGDALIAEPPAPLQRLI